MPVAIATQVDGNRLSGELHLPQRGYSPYPAVIVCHGIPSGRAFPDDKSYRSLAVKLAAKGIMSITFNFRGCGASEGNIDLAGWCRDLGSIIDLIWQRADLDRTRLSLLGFSGGAAVSRKVASGDQRVSFLALGACPAELSRLFPREDLPQIINKAREIGVIRERDFPPDPDAWLEDFYSVRADKYIGRISPRPVLILHGTEDELVPVDEARLLYEKALEPKKLWLLDGCGHRLRVEATAIQAALEWLCMVNKV